MTESKSTTPAAPHHLLAAFTLITVMSFGVWQMLQSAKKLNRTDIVQGWPKLLSGEASKSIELKLEQGLPAREQMITTAYTLRYALLGGGQEQVRIGYDDWLFLTEESVIHPQALINQQAHIALISATATALAQQQVHLVIALVPDKSRIYASHIPARYRTPQFDSRYQDALLSLRNLGVDTVDLASPLTVAAHKQEIYYRSDTHWNQLGAQVAAQAIATDITQAQLDLPHVKFNSIISGKRYARSGDLIRLMGLEHAPLSLRPTPDFEIPVESIHEKADDTQALFGDTQIAVVLCGTSYSLRGNFSGYLQQALSTEVLNTAKDGGGFLNSIAEYLKNDAYQQSKPKVLIWEIPERFLQTPLDDESKSLSNVGLNQ